MIFVVGGCIIVSTGLELLLPIILLVALVEGVSSGAIQNSLAQWFAYWVFTPSFFSWAVPVFLLAVAVTFVFFSEILDHFLYNKVPEKLMTTAMALLVVSSILFLFAFIFNIVVWWHNLHSVDWDWLVNNFYYEWLRGPFE